MQTSKYRLQAATRIIRSKTLADLSPIPVKATKISESAMTLFQSLSPGAFWRSNFRRALQGANSASTANVTRMRICVCSGAALKGGATEQRHRSKDRPLQILGRSAGHALGAALGDVAVGFVPAHCALQRSGYRPRLKSQFTLRSRAIHKHHVPGDFDAFDRNSRLTPDQPREHGIGIGYAQSEPVRNFQAGRAQSRYFCECVQHGLERQILSTQQVALAYFAFFGNQQVSRRALLHANKIQASLDVTR